MTIDEKLSHFYDITVEDARAKAAAILEKHKETLEKMTEERKALSEENAQTQIKAETANARREVNKALSAEQLTIKRDWTKKQNELKDALQKAISNKEIGIILLTEKFGREFPEIIDDVKLHHKTPLIIEIPDRHGTGRKPDFITSYVNEAIGLKL